VVELENEWTRWWVPDEPETRALGSLRFDTATGAHLILLEPLPGVRAGEMPSRTLLGETPDGEALTLIQPIAVSQSRKTGGRDLWSLTTIEAPTMLRGDHEPLPAGLTLDHAIVRFAGLREVCEHVWPKHDDGTGKWLPFIGDDWGGRAVELTDGTLTFRRTQLSDGAQDVDVVISPRKQISIGTLEDDWLQPLEAFVLFAARGPTLLQSFHVVRRAVGAAETSIEVLTQTPTLAPKPPSSYDRLLLPFAALRNAAPSVMNAWWHLYSDLGPAAGFMNAALAGDVFLEFKLMTRMSFLESYHRIRHGEPVVAKSKHRQLVTKIVKSVEDDELRAHYKAALGHAYESHSRDRVKEMVDRAAATLPDVAGLDDKLVDNLVDTRNAFVHLDPTGPKPLDDIDLVYGTARLLLVLQTNILLDIGLSAEQAGSLILTSYQREMPIEDYR
jgi:ApeA N-terminal domain 1